MDHVQSYRGKNSFFGGSAGFSKPEWVICGGRLSVETVRVLASKELTYAELKVYYTHQDIHDGGIVPASSVVTSRRITLQTSMNTFIIIDGPDYATCLKYLFEQWSPDQEKNPLAIESPTGRLEYPSRPQIGY